MSTAIWSVQTAVEETLEGAAGMPSGVEIDLGKPEPLPAKCILLWEVTAKRDFAAIAKQVAGQKLWEMIDLTLVVEVALASGTQYKPADEEAEKIFKAMDTALRADLTLGGVWKFDHFSEIKKQFFRQDKRRGCRVFVTLSGKAQI